MSEYNRLKDSSSETEDQIGYICQLQGVPQMAESFSVSTEAERIKNRLKRFSKRRLRYMKNSLREFFQKKERQAVNVEVITGLIQPGDIVRVRSKDQIQASLNRWDSLKGCAFMEEMWSHCGKTYTVRKRVNRFLDERDYRVKKTKNIIILEDVHCNGTVDFGPCDRSCFFFWREEWLEKLKEDRTKT